MNDRTTDAKTSQRIARMKPGGESNARAIHAGVPNRSSGAATREYTRCCTMWMLKR